MFDYIVDDTNCEDDEDDDLYIIGAVRPSVCHKSDYFRPTIYLGPGRPS